MSAIIDCTLPLRTAILDYTTNNNYTHQHSLQYPNIFEYHNAKNHSRKPPYSPQGLTRFSLPKISNFLSEEIFSNDTIETNDGELNF